MFNRICDEMAGGTPLAVVCLEDWAPHKTKFYKWLRKNKNKDGVVATYRHAREVQAHGTKALPPALAST